MLSATLIEFFAIFGAAGIAVVIFMIIVLLADRPVKAFIMALIFSYLLYFVYMVVINRILKRKEEKRATDT